MAIYLAFSKIWERIPEDEKPPVGVLFICKAKNNLEFPDWIVGKVLEDDKLQKLGLFYEKKDAITFADAYQS